MLIHRSKRRFSEFICEDSEPDSEEVSTKHFTTGEVGSKWYNMMLKTHFIQDWIYEVCETWFHLICCFSLIYVILFWSSVDSRRMTKMWHIYYFDMHVIVKTCLIQILLMEVELDRRNSRSGPHCQKIKPFAHVASNKWVCQCLASRDRLSLWSGCLALFSLCY